jgi:AcrR family transcriptional regulator
MAATSRGQRRVDVTDQIMDAARRQLGEVGAAGLSLRSVAREIGMVSSAVYRYVASRDDLLTRLIIEAYDSVGSAAEDAARDHADSTDLERWVATASTVRSWALEHPHQYLLLYGSPVPGYAAPDDTVGPGTRVTFALVSVLRDAADGGRLRPASTPAVVDRVLADDLRRLAGVVEIAAPDRAVLAFLVAWTQLFGLISFELTNQTRTMATDPAALFVAATTAVGHHMGLR